MCIFIAESMSQLLRAFVVLILKMCRNRHRPHIRYSLHRILDPHIGRIALRSRRDIGGRLGEDDLALRHSDPLHRLRRAHRDHKRIRIRISDILGSADHDPAGNKLHILTCIQHSGQVIDRRIRVRSTHALDECRDRIVVVIPVMIVANHPFLDTFRRDIDRDMDLSVLRLVRRENSELDRI